MSVFLSKQKVQGGITAERALGCCSPNNQSAKVLAIAPILAISRNIDHHAEYFTFPTGFHLLFPVIVKLTLTVGPVHKPAKISDLILPGSTVISPFIRAVQYIPARPKALIRRALQ